MRKDKYKVSDGGGSGSGSGGGFFDGNRPISKLPQVGDNYGTSTVTAFLEAAYFPFVAATISLSNPGVQEKGLIGGVSLNFTATKNANSETVFSNGRIIRVSDSAQVATFAAGAGAKPATAIAGVIAQTQYRALEDVGNNGSPTTIQSAIVTVPFAAPTYYGVGAAGLTEVQIKALTKRIRLGTNDMNLIFNPTLQRYYYAYPASFGALSQIIDPNGFDIFAAFTRIDQNFTLPDGTIEPYYIYRSNADTTQSNYPLDFIF